MSGSQSQTQTSSSNVDPGTRAYIEEYRRRAQNQTGYQTGLGGLDQYFNPYEANVIGGVQSDFDRQRAQANNAAGDMATRAGAFGGSREAVLRANAMNDVNRNETSTLANLRYSGFNDAAGRLIGERQFGANNAINQLNGMTAGFTPTGQTGTSTMTQRSSLLPQILGLGAQIGGAFLNPMGAATRTGGGTPGWNGAANAPVPTLGTMSFGNTASGGDPWNVNDTWLGGNPAYARGRRFW